MVVTSEPRIRRARVRLLGTIFACAAISLAGAASALGADITKTGFAQGIQGFPTLSGGAGLGVFEAGTPVLPADAVREVGTFNVHVSPTLLPDEAPFAGDWKAYAVTDIRYHTDAGVVYPMNLQLADTAWAGEFGPEVAQKLTWLLRHADALIATESDTTRAAAAIQIVVWQTLRNPQHNPPFLPRADLDTPSVEPAVNAIAATFTVIMDANYASEQSAIGVTVGAAVGCSSTVTITGTPGTPVLLSASTGGTLSANAVVLGQNGTATVTLTASTGTTVTMNAVVNTGGVLVRADGIHAPDEHTTPTHRTQAPEELIFLAGASATATPGKLVCPGSTSTPPGGVTGTPSGPVAKLTLVKTGPLTAVAGQVVVYRIKVKNTGAASAQSVLLRDILPSGLSLSKRPAGATVRKGLVQWKIPSLAPGASKAVVVKVKIDRSVTGTRCNKANASAQGIATMKTVACTAVRAVAGAGAVPSVTG